MVAAGHSVARQARAMGAPSVKLATWTATVHRGVDPFAVTTPTDACVPAEEASEMMRNFGREFVESADSD